MTNLTYTFGVHFKDGSEYFQTPEDVSVKGKFSGSAFSDIKDRLAEIELFQLEGNGKRIVVDLRDGHFEIDGFAVLVGDPSVHIPQDTERRLVYFRRVSQVAGYDVKCVGHGADGAPIWESTGEYRTRTAIQYHVGWQATVNGKNHQVTMAVIG